MSLDAHARAPEAMKQLFKVWQKSSIEAINNAGAVIDLLHIETAAELQLKEVTGIPDFHKREIFGKFLSKPPLGGVNVLDSKSIAYEVKAFPGLCIYPFLLPRDIQVELLNRLLHRDLSNRSHKSNLHLHYHVSYPENESENKTRHLSRDQSKSFFLEEASQVFFPKDGTVHKPLTIKQMLDRKLRWVTLGGQYDWTTKAYPTEAPPQFPSDIACLLKGLFPDVDAQAAIVNFYNPGDTLSVHRDVSEECNRSLISISIGCDGLFIVGNENGETATVRLRSGDVVLMSGSSRYVWHAVPKILPNSCPEWLEAWPADDSEPALESWRGWIATKRINVNVRQMRAED